MTAPAQPVVIRLPATIDRYASLRLADELLAERGRPVRLDASQVIRLGALALQVLLSASRSWATDGQRFIVEAPSDVFKTAMARFGAPPLGASE